MSTSHEDKSESAKMQSDEILSRNIQFNREKNTDGVSRDDKMIDLLIADKNQRVIEMSEYNRRLDKTITVYITALYAAIGLGVANKFNLDIGNKLFYVPIAFTFVFLNLCIIIHALSQSFWTMSLSKYIHFVIDLRIRDILFSKVGTPPIQDDVEGQGMPFSCTWDDWTWEMKGCANFTRLVTTILWFVLVHAISITALVLVNIEGFIKADKNNIWFTSGGAVILYVILVYFWYSLSELNYLSSKFHTNPEFLKSKPAVSMKSLCVGITAASIVTVIAVCSVLVIGKKIDRNDVKDNGKAIFKLEGEFDPSVGKLMLEGKKKP